MARRRFVPAGVFRRGFSPLGAGCRITAGMVAAAVCLVLIAATSRTAQVRAADPPTPGIITAYAGGGSGSGPARLIPQNPQGVAIDSLAKTLYVPDYTGWVRAIDLATDNATVVAGNGVGVVNSGDGGAATAASLKRPSSVAVDAGGNVYIATFDSVRKVTMPGGTIATVAGPGTGALGDGGPATSATVAPNGVAVNSAGDLYIADSDNRARKVDHTTGVITTVAGTGGCCGPATDGTAAVSDAMGVEDVAIDTLGNLWILDNLYDRVYEVDHTTGLIKTVAGGGTGKYDTGDGGPATQATIFGPTGIFVNGAGNLWISEGGGERIREVDHATGYITTVAGAGIDQSGVYIGGFNGDGISALTAHLDVPGRSVVDGSGNLYIPTSQDHRVRIVTAGVINTMAGNGYGCGDWGNGGPATAAMFCGARGVAFDSTGDAFVADGAEIREINASSGLITDFAGGGAGCIEPCSATSFQLHGSGPWFTGVAVDAASNVMFTDGNSVQKVSGGTISPFAGTGTSGYNGDGIAATSAQLSAPNGLALDAAGDVYVADTGNNRIRKVDHSTGLISTVTSVTEPLSVAINSLGDLFYTALTSPSLYALPHSGGSVDVTLPNLPARDVAVGPGDRVFITVPGDPRYVTGGQTVYLLTSGNPVPVAGNGTTGISGIGGPAQSAQFYGPELVAADPFGNLFLTDDFDPRLLRIQAYTTPDAPGNVTASAGDNSVKVHWYAPHSTGGLPLTQYTLTPYANGIAGTQVVLTGSPLPLGYSASGLTNGTTYTFTVKATTAWGDSASSLASNPVVPGNLLKGYISTHAGSVGTGAATSIAMRPFALALGPVDIVYPGNTPNAHLYVGDTANAVVRDVAVGTGRERVLVGSESYGFTPDGTPAASTMMFGAGAIAYCNGYTYFADTPHYVIRRVGPDGAVTTVAGTGVRGYNGDGPGTSTQITRVFGMTCTGSALTFADADSGLIRFLDGGGNLYTAWYGFSFPTALVYDNSGYLFVVDSGTNRVWYDNPTFGWKPFVGGGSTPSCTQCLGTDLQLRFPRSIAYDGANIYVADADNNRVLAVSTGGLVTTTVSGFNGPRAIVLAPKTIGQVALFVADTGADVIREVDDPSLATTYSSTVAGNGFSSLSGDGGQATAAQLAQPNAVAADSAGDLFVADTANNELRVITPDGTIKKVASIGFPDGLAFDTTGNLYVSDSASSVIDRVDPATGAVVTYFPAGVLNNPGGIAFDALNNLYVADAGNNRVLKVAPGGGAYTVYVGSTVLSFPTSVRMIGGKLYIADAGHNRVVRVVNGAVTTVAGSGVAGFAGDGQSATAARLNVPFDVAGDASGNIYIADGFNQRIRMIDGSGTISTVVSICGGVAGFSGDAGPASTSQLNVPVGLAVDSSGNVYIADAFNNRVRKVAGLADNRQAACPGVESTPGSRGAGQSPAGSSPIRLISYAGMRADVLDQPPVRSSSALSKPTKGVAPSRVVPPAAASSPGSRFSSVPSTYHQVAGATAQPHRQVAIAARTGRIRSLALDIPFPPYILVLLLLTLAVASVIGIQMRRRLRRQHGTG